MAGLGDGASGETHAVLWRNHALIDLGTFPGGTLSVANAINKRGQVVGGSMDGAGLMHAFVWQNGRMTNLGTLPGMTTSEAQGVNDHGDVVGAANFPDGLGPQHAVLWAGGKIFDLGTELEKRNDLVGAGELGHLIGHHGIDAQRSQNREQVVLNRAPGTPRTVTGADLQGTQS